MSYIFKIPLESPHIKYSFNNLLLLSFILTLIIVFIIENCFCVLLELFSVLFLFSTKTSSIFISSKFEEP